MDFPLVIAASVFLLLSSRGARSVRGDTETRSQGTDVSSNSPNVSTRDWEKHQSSLFPCGDGDQAREEEGGGLFIFSCAESLRLQKKCISAGKTHKCPRHLVCALLRKRDK